MREMGADLIIGEPPEAECLPGAQRDDLSGVAVVIPAWKPEQSLLKLVADLQSAGIVNMIVVDDGSGPDHAEIFAQLAPLHGISVCRHTENKGKGRALKTAFQRVIRSMPKVRGVITADADGQHLAEDILHVARQFARTPDHAVLGARAFTGRVPRRSRWGNAITKHLFRWLTGYRVRDTQTGLRGLPASLLPHLIALPGERYEYEMVMLAYLCQQAGPVQEVEIATVYLDGNRGSHFDPLRDPFRVYGALFRASFGTLRLSSHRLAKPKPHLRHV